MDTSETCDIHGAVAVQPERFCGASVVTRISLIDTALVAAHFR